MLCYIIAAYVSQRMDDYSFDKNADETAELLSEESFSEAVSNILRLSRVGAVLPFVCRFGNKDQIKAAIQKYETSDDKKRMLAALVLSDTSTAFWYLRKKGDLRVYAWIRGKTEEEISERFISDIGLDENGRYLFDLETVKVYATLTPDFTLALSDSVTGKELRTLPKKDIEPALLDNASGKLKELRSTMKDVVRFMKNRLYNGFLDKKSFPSEEWKAIYLLQPLSNMIARRIVWCQGDRTFILSEKGIIDSLEHEYILTDEPVVIAHPMEMTKEDVTAWQKYFTRKGLAQLFSQIWEPVIEESSFSPDRYSGIVFDPADLRYRENAGISFRWFGSVAFKYSNDLTIKGFSVEYGNAPMGKVYIQKLQPDKWGRRTNLIIGILDRIALYPQIRNDSLTSDSLDGFTLYQIMRLIELAVSEKSLDSMIVLLNDKHEHFGDLFPMKDFILKL